MKTKFSMHNELMVLAISLVITFSVFSNISIGQEVKGQGAGFMTEEEIEQIMARKEKLRLEEEERLQKEQEEGPQVENLFSSFRDLEIEEKKKFRPLSFFLAAPSEQPLYLEGYGDQYFPFNIHDTTITSPIKFPHQNLTFYLKTKTEEGVIVFEPQHSLPIPASIEEPLVLLSKGKGNTGMQAKLFNLSDRDFKLNHFRILNLTPNMYNVKLDDSFMAVKPQGELEIELPVDTVKKMTITSYQGDGKKNKIMYHRPVKMAQGRKVLLVIYPKRSDYNSAGQLDTSAVAFYQSWF